MRVKILLITLLSVSIISAQKREDNYIFPVNLPPSLSANYGELRATHFHSGIDIRVGGVSGASVLAANDGYISRISVSPTGYGNAIYIDHPNGRTSQYGHLHEFAPAIAKWVREQQYERQSFVVNLMLPKEKFPVKRGDVIGKAGNTGSSGGPHLHFEIRESSTQIPLNPISEAKFKINDNIPPEIKIINLYSVSTPYSIPESRLLKSLSEAILEIIPVSDTFYAAVWGYDRQNNTNGKLAVSSYRFFLDEELIFSFTPERIPFDKGRYINSILEYSEKYNNDISMVKSRVEPGGDLKPNIKSYSDGLFIIKDDEIHQVKIQLTDEHGNTSQRVLKVKRDSSLNHFSVHDSVKLKNGVVMPWFLPNRYEAEGVRITLPPGSLYSSILFEADTIYYKGEQGWRLHNSQTPIHAPARLAMKSPFPDSLTSKALIALIGEDGDVSSLGGSYKAGWIETTTTSFGGFIPMLDTISPTIRLSFNEGANLSGRSTFRITVYDNLSGIKEYRVMIDGKWILTTYDPKNKRLETELKPDKIGRGKRHSLEIIVSDNKDNISVLKSSFIW